MSALTICAAYFGRLGDPKECELVIYRASQILQHFMPNSPQAKQYDLILRKLSRVALSCVSGTGDQQYSNSNPFWSDLFRLTSMHLRNLQEEASSSLRAKNETEQSPSQGACPNALKLSPSQNNPLLSSYADDIFSFPDGAYKDFSNYTLMPEGLLSEQDDFFLSI